MNCPNCGLEQKVDTRDIHGFAHCISYAGGAGCGAKFRYVDAVCMACGAKQPVALADKPGGFRITGLCERCKTGQLIANPRAG